MKLFDPPILATILTLLTAVFGVIGLFWRSASRRGKLTRELRSNLIVLGCLAVLTIPGGTMLTFKKLRQESGRPTFPPPVKRVFAYMDPTPNNLSLPRTTPPQTGDFVGALTDRALKFAPGLESIVRRSNFQAIMSRKLMLQLTARNPSGSSTMFMGWGRPLKPIKEHFAFEATLADGKRVPGTIAYLNQLNLPLDVRSELQEFGYIDPPSAVLPIVVMFDVGESEVSTVHFAYTDSRGSTTDELTLKAPTLDSVDTTTQAAR